jgi:hypothetical protein
MRSKSLLFLISLILFVPPAVYSQPLFSTYYSPLADRTNSLPFLEIDFSSARLQGLGYQLYPVIQDTITDLFRNPVTIYNIPDKKIYLQVENALGRYGTSGGALYSTSQFNNILFKNNIPYLSIGFWSAKSFLFNRPIGILISGMRSKDLSNYFLNEPTIDMRQNYNFYQYLFNEKYERKVNGIFLKLWTGIIHKPKFSIALSYQYVHHKSPDFRGRKENSIRESNTGYIQQLDRFYESKNPFQLDYHRLFLGIRSSYKGWKIESNLQYLKTAEESSRTEIRTDFRYEYLKTDPDSNSYKSKINSDLRNFYDPKSNIGAVNIQADKNNWTIFASVYYGKVTMNEDGHNFSDQFYIFDLDTSSRELSKYSSEFSDSGNLFRTKWGLGRRFQYKNLFMVYSALIFDLTRYSLDGKMPTKEYYYDVYNPNPPEITDTSYTHKIDYTATDYRVYLPLGWEITHKNISLRLGLTWYYNFERFENYRKSSGSIDIEKRKSEIASIHRTEYFGLGYKYKKVEVQLATFGNVFEFNLWNVSCQYSF